MRRLVYWLLIALAILPVGAHAQTDWIDEFPSVTEVAHAAFEELKVTSAMSRLDMTGDDDSIAVNLAGTLNVLRQILYLKFIAEQPMPKAREDKMEWVLLVVLIIALVPVAGGVAKGVGRLTIKAVGDVAHLTGAARAAKAAACAPPPRPRRPRPSTPGSAPACRWPPRRRPAPNAGHIR